MTKGEANINRSDTEEAKESGKKKGRQEMEGETVRERQREIRDGGKSRDSLGDEEAGQASEGGRWRRKKERQRQFQWLSREKRGDTVC